MGKLAEYLKTEADTIRKEKEKRNAIVTEWVGSINELLDQLDGWLAASDPDNLLERTSETVKVNDPSLGEYDAPARRISLENRAVQIVPRARYVATTVRPPGSPKCVQATGLVELREPGGLDHYLFRLPQGWFIRSAAAWNSDPDYDAVEPLDRDRFEAAILQVLR